MKCARCGKTLQAYAAAIETADGTMGWGPKCARLAFSAARRRARASAKSAAVARRHHDSRQGDLFA